MVFQQDAFLYICAHGYGSWAQHVSEPARRRSDIDSWDTGALRSSETHSAGGLPTRLIVGFTRHAMI